MMCKECETKQQRIDQLEKALRKVLSSFPDFKAFEDGGWSAQSRTANKVTSPRRSLTNMSATQLTDLDELIKVCERAKQGEWQVGPNVEDLPYRYANFVHVKNTAVARVLRAEDANFIATCDPQRCLALLKELKRLQGENAKLSKWLEEVEQAIILTAEDQLHD